MSARTSSLLVVCCFGGTTLCTLAGARVQLQRNCFINGSLKTNVKRNSRSSDDINGRAVACSLYPLVRCGYSSRK